MDSPLALPPNIDRNTFARALKELRAIVGEPHVSVLSSREQLDDGDYLHQPKAHDGFHLLAQDELIASCTIEPATVEHVQDVVKLANKYKIPLWPISIGRNLGYGGAAPRVRGSVVLDMGKRMNKVLELNAQNATVLLEPGVTYFDLLECIKGAGLEGKLWTDVPDLGGGSVMGNALERGVGYTPYGDHFMMHCGMEIVLPNGELLRTGMGALPGNNSWQLFQYGFGPYLDGMFTQANYGIVTKLGMWLMPDPGGYQPYMITIPKDGDLHQATEIIRPLRIGMVMQNVPTIRHVLMDAACLGPKSRWTDSSAPLSDERIDEIAQELGLGRWNFYGAVYGPKAVRDASLNVIKEAFSAIPGSKLYFPEDVKDPKAVLHMRALSMKGVPSLDELAWIDWLPNGSHLFFSPISPTTGNDATKQANMVRRACEAAGFDYFSTFLIGLREMHHIVCLVYNRHDPDSKRRAYKLLKELVEEGCKEGYGEYRTHLALQDKIANTYSFNGGILNKVNEMIKNALDPNGIIAPGKNGIWPKSYRKEEWSLDSENFETRLRAERTSHRNFDGEHKI